MKTLTFKFDAKKLQLSTKDIETLKDIGYNQGIEVVILAALQGKFQQGLDRGKRKSLARIQDALDEVHTPLTGEATLTLEEAEYDLLKSLFLSDEGLIPAVHNRMASIIEDAVETAVAE